MSDFVVQEQGIVVPHASKREIWYAFIILTVVTILEFVIAFTLERSVVRTGLFLALTVMKAYYIVAYFMHMRHERVGLVASILLPLIFLIYMIALLLMETA